MRKGFFHKPIVHVLLIILLGVLAYSNTFDVPFVYDDIDVIVKNPIVKNLQYFVKPLEAKKYEGHFEYKHFKHRYVGYLTFALNYKLHGLDVTGYHIVNLSIHIFNGLLVYLLITLSFKTPQLRNSVIKDYSKLIAVFSAIFFTCHPIQTMAVTYIWQRVSVLATTFYILSLVSYIKYRLKGSQFDSESEKRLNTRSLFFYLISVITAILAMKTKEISFTLPVIIALYEFMFFEGKIKKRILYLIPLLLTMLIIPLSLTGINRPVNEIMAGVNEATRFLSTLPRSVYLFTEFRVIITYIRLIFFPAKQNVEYDYPIYTSFFNMEVLISFLFILLFFGFGVYLFYRYRNTALYTRLLSFGIFWFFITLSVESSFIPLIRVIDEYRLYLSLPGFLIMIITFLFVIAERLKPRWRKINTGILATLIGAAVILTGLTYIRNTVWKDKISLWEDTANKSPMKGTVHGNLGEAYLSLGYIDKAIKQFQIARHLDPQLSGVYYNLGKAYYSQGLTDKAIEYFKLEILNNPDFQIAYNDLGDAYLSQGLTEDAIKQYQNVIKIKSYDSTAHYNLGRAYKSQGLTDKAIRHFQAAILIDPGFQGAHINLGNAYLSQGLTDKAIKHFQTAIKIDPDYSAAHYNLGRALQYKGLNDEAITYYENAVRLDPENITLRINVGNVYQSQGYIEKAIKQYQIATQIAPDYPVAYYNLGIAYSKAGDNNSALKEYEKLKDLDAQIAQKLIDRINEKPQ